MKNYRQFKLFGWLIPVFLVLLSACTPAAPAELILATTTSTQDSGLLDYLLPEFEQNFHIRVKVVAVGSGQAIQMGKDGNADVLLVHSPIAEQTFMAEKHGLRRESVMFNDFILVGPESDPARIAGMTSAAEAFRNIAASEAVFISRGDDSGTHAKEKSIWAAAEINPAGNWYIRAGQGMGEVLTMAKEKQAYTLTDRATYLTMIPSGLSLKIMVESDALLRNPYSVIAVNPAKNARIKQEIADQFIEWLISVPVQQKIADFKKEELGQSLFIPDSQPWHKAPSIFR